MEPRTLTYRRSWLVRAFLVLLILIFFAGLFMIGSGILSKPHPDYGALLPFVLIFVGPSLLLWRMSGPNDIYFYLEQKTYRYIKGWPLFAKTRTGPLSDLSGVYIRETRNQGYVLVGLTWEDGGSTTLEMFSNRVKAEQFVASLMSDLGLKQVMPPRNLRPSP